MAGARGLLRKKAGEIKIINLGLEIFYQSLKAQGAKVYHVRHVSRRLEKDLEDILSKI